MGARHWNSLPSWSGFLLVVVGFLSLTGSYFLLPLYVTTLDCSDSCTPATAWQFSLNVLSRFSIAPPVSAGILVLLWLPLLAAAAALGCSFGLLVHPWRAFAAWTHASLLAGSIALAISSLLYIVLLRAWIRPEGGFFGMLVGYILLWAGSHLLVEARL